jgi:hypothetical protein
MSVSAPRPEFVVFAPPYDPNVGGYIALHYLCHLLNEVGYKAYLVPFFNSAEISPIDSDSLVAKLLDQRAEIQKNNYTVNAAWNTPIYRRPWRGIAKRDDLVVVYPEVVFGNPLRAKNVARWLLHDPGFHNKQVYFVPGEVHFRFLAMHQTVPMPWIEIAKPFLTVSSLPWEHYQPPLEGSPRSGTAYILRKGRDRPLVHDLADSIQVDGMSHAQIGEICRKVKTFISYDPRTTYSYLAALTGVDSVVIPEEEVTAEMWQPDPALRAGVAYGFDDIDRARRTVDVLARRMTQISDNSRASVSRFADFWFARLNPVQSVPRTSTCET